MDCVYLKVIIVCSLLTSSYMNAQPSQRLQFEHITPDQGMPGRYVFSIAQDSIGFIWTGTSYGLARYDGYSVRSYRYDPKDSSVISNIKSVVADKLGGIWMGTNGQGLVHLDVENGEFTHYLNDRGDLKSISHNFITTIHEDLDGVLWIGTYGGGLNQFNRKTKRFKRFQNILGDTSAFGYDWISQIHGDSPNYLWIVTNKSLLKFNQKTESFNPVFSADSNYLDRKVISRDHTGIIWLGAYNTGLFLRDSQGGDFQPYPSSNSNLSSNRITCISPSNQAGLWIGTQDRGLNHLDLNSFESTVYTHDPTNPFSLSNDFVNTIFVDKEDNQWFGTYLGLNRVKSKSHQFVLIQNEPEKENSLGDNRIWSIYEDNEGIVWIGSNGGGLTRWNRKKNEYTTFRYDPDDTGSISDNRVYCIAQDEAKRLWVGTANGLNFLDRQTLKFKRYQSLNYNPKDSTSIIFNVVNKLYLDSNGRFWIGTSFGVDLFDSDRDHFTHFQDRPEDPDGFELNGVYGELTEDQLGNIWVPTFRGIIRIDPITAQFTRYSYDSNQSNSISADRLNHLYQNHSGQILVTSSAGMDIIESQGDLESQISVIRKVLSIPINSIQEDHHGNLWLGTLRGLIHYNPLSRETRIYDVNDGLPSNQFNPPAFKSPRTGELFFGTNNGLVIFHPDSLKDNPFVPNVAITSMYYYDSKEESGLPIEVPNISYQSEVTFPYYQNSLIVEFAALSFQKTAKNQYAYRFVGQQETWNQLGTERRLQFPDLEPGTYNLQVKGSNGDGVWNEEGTRLKIVILPPWWWGTPAKVAYALLFLALLFGFYRFQLNRQLALAETQRLRELDEVKNRLYTNITHEFRTPLTIILGMADQAVNNPREWLLDGVRMIKRNGHRLLHLVNQMLDLTKLESGSMPLHPVNADVIYYLRYVNESFHAFSEIKGISLHFLTAVETYHMDFDPTKLIDIVSNLLSNAIKYTPEGGNIYMQVQALSKEDTPWLEMKVIDTGIGMSEEEVSQVFDRFYQGTGETGGQRSHTQKAEGTGVGLALTKELVKLMGGNIAAESRKGKGSTFTLVLPVTQQAVKGGPPEELLTQARIQAIAEGATTAVNTEVAPQNTNLPLLLLIDDNQDVMQYLITCLAPKYQLVTATDGEMGIEKAIELVPDIIITDLVMPKKDGFEVCNTLKKDERTSHIPIILLTAKADFDAKIEGLESGADAFLAKPFNEKELHVRLKKLVELRQNLQDHYGSQSFRPKAEGSQRPLEDEFLLKVRELVEANLSDADYGIVQLCRALHLSRSQLFRKLKALTGKSTSLFMRSIRLQRAKEMLTTTDLNVSEIAYEVGFTSPAYFTRAFSEEFGLPPSEARTS